MILLIFISFALAGCKKDNNCNVNNGVQFCPLIQVENYEGAGKIINDYLECQKNNDSNQNLNNLKDWFECKECVDSVVLSGVMILTFPPQTEYFIKFEINGNYIEKIIDIFIYDDGHLEFNLFHETSN